MTEISKEYASALFALCCEQGCEKQVMEDLEKVSSTFSENPEFVDFLASPGITLDARLNAVDKVFLPLVCENTLSFTKLLCEKGRIRIFSDCEKQYRMLFDIRQSVSIAKVTSAAPLTEKEISALKQKLEKLSGNSVELECSVDTSLIGGITVEMDGKVIDGSIKRRLHNVKEVMNR